MAATDVVVRYIGDASSAVRAAKQTEDATAKTAASVRKTGLVLSAAVTLPLVAFGKASVQAASDLNESLSKSNTIFEQNGRAVERWASGAAEAFGQSKQGALENAASFGNMFRQMEFGIQPATRMSKSMVELASDFASFHNADITEVLQAQQAAFRGEYDAVQRFVPTINAAAVETKALAMTGKENASQLTAQEKALATYKLMLDGAGKAMGDFDRTAGGAANQQRILAAQLENLQASVGAILLPALQQVVGVLSVVADAFQSLPRPVQTAIVAVGVFAAALGPILTIAGNLGRAATAIRTAFTVIVDAAGALTGALTNMYLTVAAAPAAFAALATGVAVIFAAGFALHEIFGKDLAGEIRNALTAGEELGKSLVTQASGIADLTAKHDQLSASLRDLKAAEVDSFDAAVRNAAARREVKAALAEVEGQQEAARVAAEAERAAMDALATAQRGVTGATNEQISAVMGLANAYLASQGGILGLQAAQINQETAQKRLDDLIANGSTPDTLEYRSAVNQLEQSKLAAAGAALKMQADNQTLANMLDGPGRSALLAMRDSLQLTVDKHLDATGAAQEQINKINLMIDVANGVPPEKSIYFNAETWAAIRDIAEVSSAADQAARDRTMHFLAQIEFAGTHGTITGAGSFASGGVVPGPRNAPQLAIVHGGETILPVGTAVSGGGTSGPTYNISIHVDPGVSPAEVGARTVDAIRQYERVAGKAWRS